MQVEEVDDRSTRSGQVPPSNYKHTELFKNAPKNSLIFMSYKIPEFFKKSPLSEAEKHPNFQVTL